MKRSVYIFFLILSLTSCQKCKDKVQPQEKLPDATQTGQDTYGCMLNGQVWVNTPTFPNSLTANYYNGYLSIYAKRVEGNTKQYIFIARKNTFTTGTYTLNDSISAEVHFTDLANGCDYYTDSVNTGQLIVTRLDTINRIFSGQFSFKLKKSGCPDIIANEGRFDVRE